MSDDAPADVNRIVRALRARRVALTIPAILVAIAAASLACAADFSPSAQPRALAHAGGIYEWRFEAARGPSPFDRIGLHRIASGPNPPQRTAPVLLYLPGTHMNGEVAVDDPHNSFALCLATRGIDTWSLDYRTHFVPPDTPERRLAELKTWNNELFESDIDAAVDFILATTHRGKIFVGGFSRGVFFAYLYAARHPGRVAGIVALDGFIANKPMASGAQKDYAIDIGGRHLTYEKRKALAQLVIRNPDGPSPILKYKTARENLEHVVYDAASFGGRGGLANPQGGFSDPIILARVMLLYDRWWPSVQDYEDSVTPKLSRALGRSKIPVIAFSDTNIAPGWPEMVRKSAASTGSGDVTFTKLVGWGHLDVLCGTRAESEVYAPVAAWITQHAK